MLIPSIRLLANPYACLLAYPDAYYPDADPDRKLVKADCILIR